MSQIQAKILIKEALKALEKTEEKREKEIGGIGRQLDELQRETSITIDNVKGKLENALEELNDE